MLGGRAVGVLEHSHPLLHPVFPSVHGTCWSVLTIYTGVNRLRNASVRSPYFDRCCSVQDRFYLQLPLEDQLATLTSLACSSHLHVFATDSSHSSHSLKSSSKSDCSPQKFGSDGSCCTSSAMNSIQWGCGWGWRWHYSSLCPKPQQHMSVGGITGV